MNKSVFADKPTLHVNALRVPVNDLGGDLKKRERLDEPSVSNRRCTLNDSTAASSDHLVETGSLIKVDASEIQLTQVSALME